MFRLIVLLSLILLAIYFLKRIIKFLKEEVFKDKVVLNTLDTEIDNLKDKVLESGKKSVAKEVEKKLSKEPRLSFAKNFITELLKTKKSKSIKKTANTQLNEEDNLIIAALVKLGFKKQQSIQVLKSLPPDFKGSMEEKIKELLKMLGKKQ